MKKLLIVCLLSVLPVSAKIIYVSPTAAGTADGSSFANSKGTIQAGIDASVSGDTILLNDGEYPGSFAIAESLTRITISSQYLSLHDSSHIAATIINCLSRTTGDMIYSNATLDTTSAFIGITFQDLPKASYTIAVYNNKRDLTGGPKFRRCRFLRNSQCFGDGDFLADSCLFSGNAEVMVSNNGSLQMRYCIIEKGTDVIGATNRLTVLKCEVRDNKPATWLFSGHFKSFESTNFTGNGNSSTEATIAYMGGTFDTTVFKNCVFSNDTAQTALFKDIYGLNFTGCKFYNNSITGSEGGLFIYCRNMQIQHSLIYATNGLIVDNFYSDYPFTVSGSTIAGNNALGIFRNNGTIKVINSIVTDSISSNVEAYFSLLKIDPTKLTASSRNNILNRDPLFVNATARDYHLKGYSPAIDAGSPDSTNLSENQNCYFTADNRIVDMGYYGNTPEATCRKQSTAGMKISGTMRPNLYLNEVVYDTLIVKDTSQTDTIVTYDTAAVTSDISGVSCLRVSPNYTVLKPGDSCFIYLRHEGKTNGGGAVTIGFNANQNSRNFSYSGTVSTKTFDDVFANSWVCPATVTGSSTTSTFPLKNLGNNPVTITGITFASSLLSQFTVVGKTYPFTIKPGDSVTLSARFSPPAAVSYSVPFTISTPNIVGGVDNTLLFTGTGIQTGITVAPKDLPFGSVLIGETDSSQVLTIRNENPVAISVTAITFDIPQFSISGSTPFSLASGEVKPFKVKFAPASQGLKMGIMTIHNTSILDSTSKVTLSGTGVQAGLSLSGTTLNFGSIPAGTTKGDSIQVTNNGSGTLKIDTINSTDTNFIVMGNKGKQQIAPNSSFWLKVNFSPKDTTLPLSKSISIVSNAPSSPHSIAVTGTGTKSSLKPVLSMLVNFGRRALTSTSDSTIAIANIGNALVTITDTNTTNTAFKIITFPATIAAKQNADITIRFKSTRPNGGDFQDAVVSLLYTDGADTGTLAISVSGSAVGKPHCDSLKISPTIVAWDTTGQIAFQSFADDSDDAGTGARLVKYLWRSSIDGALTPATSSFTIKPSSFSIGTHSITCRVIDNEGDTSGLATASLTITNRLPHAKVLSITPAGLILKGSGSVIFTGEGWDLDQFANNTKDSLKSFDWYSTAQGLLGSGKTLTINSSTLQLGNHGFYIKVTDNENATACSDTLWMPVQTSIGRALIVAGTAFDDNAYFTKNIAPNCNWAYQKLLDRGFSHQQIYYMNPIGWQSLSDPYANSKIVDTTVVTLNTLRDFMLSAAVKNDVQNSVPLILYLLGHGSSALNNGRFYLNKTEYLTPDTLAAWLDSYGDLPSTAQIIVILDFCYSGSYQAKLRTSYIQNRAVITSSDASNIAYFSSGKCFAWNIWNDVYRGNNLATAFTDALDWSNTNAPGTNKANPLLNCDKNGTYNATADYDIAKTIYIGGSQQLQSLTSRIDSAGATAPSDGITITAHIKGVFTKVWSRLYPPNFDPASSPTPPAIMLTKVNDSTWSGVYTGSRVAGTYLVITEGTDGDGKFVMGVSGEVANTVVFTAVRQQLASRLPTSVVLGALYPNPVVGAAMFSYGLPSAMNVKLSIYDLRGRQLVTLVDAHKQAGYYQAFWNLNGCTGQKVGIGHYVYKLVAGRKVIIRNLVVGR